ncbi:KEOPS complex kinase/ATPase Bud32 [Nanoarchaeota archaeon]
MKQMIAQGAEAKVYFDDERIVKDRFKKKYRHPEIDEKLRKRRTRSEGKILEKLQKLEFPSPEVMSIDDSNMQIGMQFIDGEKLRDALYKSPIKLSEEMGRKIGILHSNDIIHSDLTTSNMIVGNEINFIDFGLSFISNKDEDKAVDLHLLHRALESKHHDIYERCFESVLKGYRQGYPGAEDVLTRFERVQARGRNKKK